MSLESLNFGRTAGRRGKQGSMGGWAEARRRRSGSGGLPARRVADHGLLKVHLSQYVLVSRLRLYTLRRVSGPVEAFPGCVAAGARARRPWVCA